MKLVKGDKIILKKNMGVFGDVGTIYEVTHVDESGLVSFKSEGSMWGALHIDKIAEYCDKYEEPKITNTITQEHIEKVMNNSKVIVYKSFDKCTIVACKLPNGFVIVESSSCVNPENYNEDIGVEICMNRIKDKVCELEGYKLQTELYENSKDAFKLEKTSRHTNCCEEDCDDCEIRQRVCDEIHISEDGDCETCYMCSKNGGCCGCCDK